MKFLNVLKLLKAGQGPAALEACQKIQAELKVAEKPKEKPSE